MPFDSLSGSLCAPFNLVVGLGSTTIEMRRPGVGLLLALVQIASSTVAPQVAINRHSHGDIFSRPGNELRPSPRSTHRNEPFLDLWTQVEAWASAAPPPAYQPSVIGTTRARRPVSTVTASASVPPTGPSTARTSSSASTRSKVIVASVSRVDR